MANNLCRYWDRPVRELASRHEVGLGPEEQERHRIYSFLLMAITAHFWNGNKYGPEWEYPLNPAPAAEGSKHLAGSYIGHNIAALAVAGDGEIIDFEFNHNEIFNSSVEHAESRLLRRVFALRQISDSWDVDGGTNPNKDYGTLLGNVSIYTTLESCSQCSGVMTLAGVKEVVYFQTDPQMYNIGDILRRLSRQTGGQTYLQAPFPIAGRCIALDAFGELEARYEAFGSQQGEKRGPPFRRRRKADGGSEEFYSASITSFLCTQAAYDVYSTGLQQLKDLERRHAIGECWGGHCPDGTTRTNADVLREALDFLEYVKAKGYRASPHKV